MGISLITPGLASAAPPVGMPGLLAADGTEATGFADMLAMQLLGLGATPGKALTPAAENEPTDEALASDPALQLLAGLPLPVPPQTGSEPKKGDAPVLASVEDESATDGSTLLSLIGTPSSAEARSATVEEGGQVASVLAQSASGAVARNNVATTDISSTGGTQMPLNSTILQTLADQNTAGKPDGTPSANLAALPASASGSDFLTHLNTQLAHASGTPARAEMASVSTPLRDAAWASDFSEKVVWIARADQQNAQISINPPQLGPIQIALNISGDQATAVFASPHAEVRQAIEDAMPRLREMFAGAGIDLGQANVGAQLAQSHAREHSGQAGTAPSGNDNAILPGDADPASGAIVSPLRAGRGMVDLFA